MIEMYVVTHKKSDFLPQNRIFIGVGKDKKIDNVQVYDDNMNNISEKNSSFCELTALYWIWKNTSTDFIGFEHYRRFFCKKTSFFSPKIISSNYALKKLEKYDCVVSSFFHFDGNLYKYYEAKHNAVDLEVCKDVISQKYPSYIEAFDMIMSGNKAFMCNMFIMKKELLDSYCNWLFDILFEVENRIDISDRDAYQKRVFGFLSERLFNVWVYKNNLKIFNLPVYMPDDKPCVIKMKNFIKKILRLFRGKKDV